ncbi:MAG TPA: PDDEXK nuclease domain-containing protein [Chitinophagales bacterium]|nr:PDDEXK nuclease domain-containing protein [Chitinophagales bacterium]
MKHKIVKHDSLFESIKSVISQARSFVYQAVNYSMVHAYYKIGELIVQNEQTGNLRAEYAQKTLKKLSRKLVKNCGRGFSVDNLENMRKFYLIYNNFGNKPISETVSRKSSSSKALRKKSETVSRISETPQFKVSWSHYLVLIRIDDNNERKFYEIEAANESWSLRELKRQINSGLYERLILSRDKKKVKELSTKGLIINNPIDAIKDNHVLEFLGLEEKDYYSESDLENAILDKLQEFLLELGKGFCFVARQKRIIINEKGYRIDLVFWHRFLNCFVLIDLKTGEVLPKDVGQMGMYINYYDKVIRRRGEKKTLGLILCKHRDDKLVKIMLPKTNKQIFTSKYRLYLPNDEELQKVMEDVVPYVTKQNSTELHYEE